MQPHAIILCIRPSQDVLPFGLLALPLDVLRYPIFLLAPHRYSNLPPHRFQSLERTLEQRLPVALGLLPNEPGASGEELSRVRYEERAVREESAKLDES